MSNIQYISWDNYSVDGTNYTLDWQAPSLNTSLYYMMAIREALIERYIVVSSHLINENIIPWRPGVPSLSSDLISLYDTIKELNFESGFYNYKYAFTLFDSFLYYLCSDFVKDFEETWQEEDGQGSLFPYWKYGEMEHYWTFAALKQSLDEPWIETVNLPVLTKQKILQYYLAINKLVLTRHKIRPVFWGYPYYETDFITRDCLETFRSEGLDSWAEAVQYAIANAAFTEDIAVWPWNTFMVVKDQLSYKYINITDEPYTWYLLTARKDKYNKYHVWLHSVGHDQLIMNDLNEDFDFQREITVYPVFYKNEYTTFFIPDKFSFIADTPVYLHKEPAINPLAEGLQLPQPTQIADPFYSWDYNGDQYGSTIKYIKIADYAIPGGFKFQP